MQTNLDELALGAHWHIVMAHLLERHDADAAFKREMLAWEDAYRVGRCSADDAAMPVCFAQSRALTNGWEKARRDRAAIAAE